MKSVKLAMFCAAASTLMLYGCTTGPTPSALASGGDVAATAPSRVDNFLLADAQKLEGHELYRMGDAKAVVIVSQANGDAAVRGLAGDLKALQASYAGKGVEVMLLNSTANESRDAIVAEAAKAGFSTPILMDSNQLVGEGLGVTRSAEVFIVNPKTWTVAYRGGIGGAAKALDALVAGEPVAVASTAVSGGAQIAFPGRDSKAQITYVKDVAPILEAKCVACHEPGGIGPFAITSYEMAKGFSPMIREVIRTNRMPPYGADPHVGQFSDDKRLTSAEIKTIVHWVEQGAPRGEGKDPLGAKRLVAAEWPLGKPDLVLNIPAYTIPASGVVDYQHPWVANPEKEGKWLKASTVKVESRQGVHHVLTGYLDEVPAPGQQAFENKWGVSVGGYAVGAESEIAPKNVGTFIPPGGAIGFQTHYTPFGKEVTDHTQIALYFYKDNEKPDLVMHNSQIVNNAIVLPPNDGHHQEVAYMEFPKDALLYSAFPHAHYRGASSDLWIRYPDGKEKLLLALPHYEFNWQRHYTFAEPIKVPAGSKLIAHYVYDNSKRNPHNPDPSKEVVWGDQSWEEMFFTRIRYRWMDETSVHPVNYDEALQAGALMGMLDSNIDGKLEKSELKGQIGKMLLAQWDKIDANHDGVIDKDELAAAQKSMMSHRRQQAEAKPTAAATPTTGGK